MSAAKGLRSPSLAKLTRPRSSNLVARERLFELLDRSSDARAIWISAPGGSGKTSLLTSYITARKRNSIWYQIDAADADLPTFFHYLGLAAPRRAKRFLPLTPEYVPGLEIFSRRYFRDFFARVGQPTILVFDNYHEAGDSPELNRVLGYLLDETPQHVAVAILSRHEPAQVFARRRANAELIVIGEETMRLTLDESAALIAPQRPLDSDELLRIHALVQGWAAGLMLMTNPGGWSGDASTQQLPRTEAAFDYFSVEILEKLPASLQGSLIAWALLPSMTPAQAEQLSGDSAAAATLHDLHRRNYFIVVRGVSSPVYEFHALFRSFLLGRSTRHFTSDEWRSKQRLSAKLLEDAGNIEAAAERWIEAEAWNDLARLVHGHASVLLAQGRNEAIRQWIEEIPAEVMASTPWLSYWMGMARLALEPSISRSHFEAAFTQFEAMGDSPSALLSCAGVIRSYAYDMLSKRPLEKWGKAFQRIAQRNDAILPIELEIEALTSVGYLVESPRAHVALLEAAYERAERLLEEISDPAQRLRLVLLVSSILAMRGEQIRLLPLLEETSRLVANEGMRPLDVLELHVARASTIVQTGGDFLEALEEISRGQRFANSTGVHRFDSFLAGWGLHAALHIGDLRLAEEFSEQARSAMDPSLLLRGQGDAVGCLLALARGNGGLALSLAQASVRNADEWGTDTLSGIARILLGLALVALEDYSEALEQAAYLLEYGVASSERDFHYAGYMIRAHSLLRMGRRADALRALRSGLQLASEYRFSTLYPWSPPQFLQPLCAVALEEGIHPDYVRHLVRSRGIPPPDPAQQHWPWLVRVRTLGAFSLLVDDVPANASGKAQRRPIEMLKYLIAQGGFDVDAGALADALWPGAEADAARKSLEITLHRLRKMLRLDAAIELHNGKLSLNRDLVWVDAWSFEHNATRLDESIASATSSKALDELEAGEEQLLKLYRGHLFASDGDLPWLLPQRERLRQRFVRVASGVSDHLSNAGRIKPAILLYNRALEADPLAENLYRGLMSCHLLSGEHALALGLYARCRAMLGIVLGAKPSAETERLVATARAASSRR